MVPDLLYLSSGEHISKWLSAAAALVAHFHTEVQPFNFFHRPILVLLYISIVAIEKKTWTGELRLFLFFLATVYPSPSVPCVAFCLKSKFLLLTFLLLLWLFPWYCVVYPFFLYKKAFLTKWNKLCFFVWSSIIIIPECMFTCCFCDCCWYDYSCGCS